jgi:hypothetical protein
MTYGINSDDFHQYKHWAVFMSKQCTYFCEAGKEIFNTTQTAYFRYVTASVLDSEDFSFSFGKAF